MLTAMKVSSLAPRCVFYRTTLTGKWGPYGTEIKFLKFKTEMHQRKGLKEYMRGVICLVMFTPRVMVIKCQKWFISCTFCWIQQNISSSLGKIFKCIWKALFGPFRKYYGLCTSELPLAKFQCLKIQDFGIPLFTQKFFCLPTMSDEQLNSKPINHTIFCNNWILSSLCTYIYFPNCDKLFAIISRKYEKIAISDILKTITMEVNMITRQMTLFSSYILYALSIGMFHFKACKIQFHGVPPLH